MTFPITISIRRNPIFFAKIQWWLYKKFNIKRSIPCGRTKKERRYSCYQPIDKEHCFLNEDGTEVYCRCCGYTRILSTHPIDLEKVYDEF